MRKYIIIFILCINTPFLFAQQYGNEWIDYSRQYFKIPVTQEGVYRVTRQTLENAGFPINSVDPRNIQIFCKGQEQYIYIEGESDWIFHPSDYIEFYAKGNDGWFDSTLFEPSSGITNPFYSMYTDTMYYFLTWNNSTNNRRVTLETDINFSAYTSNLAPYCMVDVLYQNPVNYYYSIPGPRYRPGEGWFDNYFDKGQSVIPGISTPGHVSGFIPTSISFSIAGCSNASASGSYNHHLNVSFNSASIFDTLFIGYTAIKKTITTTQALTSNQLTITSIDNLGAITDKMAIAYISLSYARDFNFPGINRQSFKIENSTGTKSLVEIPAFGSSSAVLWDLSNNRKIPVVNESGILKAIVPNGSNNKTCFISSVNSVYNATVLPGKTFTNYLVTGNNSDYIIITHPSLLSSANSYKTYRNLTGYLANCYDVEQLYDQFAYGIKKHPLAIRNFLKFISANYDSVPKSVFLIGKSIHSGGNISESFRKDATSFAGCLVPSFGSPSSDNLLATNVHISGNGITNDIPIGRLAATTNADVDDYRDKVYEHEVAQPMEWMKRVIHFGGGISNGEQITFKNYLAVLESVIEDTLFGGNVETFLKTTSLPVQISVSDSVRNLINDGCSIITFFGHGSTSGFDQNIENPSDYTNQGRYPILIANSCLAGDIHLPPPQKISEEWVLIPDRGALAFLASVDLGYAPYLYLFSNEVYKQMAYKNYTNPIGKCIRDGNNALIQENGNTEFMTNTCLEFTLHGDPAVSIKSFPLPDLTINAGSIQFVPDIVTSVDDSFYVKIIVTNIGRATAESYMIHINRTFPDGSTYTYSQIANGCYFKDTVYIKLPTDFVRGSGVNQFCVTIDAENWIAEMSETNNDACTNMTIRTSDIVPIFPYEFAIFPNDSVTLKASTGYAFLETNTYQFEIDTTDVFSPPLASGTVTQSGGVITWTPPIPPLTDSTVYFWRVSVVPQGSDTAIWKESSFTYIPGKTGWSQAHFFQFKKDGFYAITYDRSARKLDFVTAPKGLHCKTIGSASTSEDFNETKYNLDAITDYNACWGQPSIMIVVIDTATMMPWESEYSRNYGQINWPSTPGSPSCPSRSRLDKYFIFPADTLHLEYLATMLETKIPDGFYILAYTFRYGNFQLWPSNTKTAFLNLGASQFLSLPNNFPYILYCKKGSPVYELPGTYSTQTLEFDTLVPTNYTSGYVRSTLIGPSANWQTLHWRQYPSESPTQDQVNLDVTGYKLNHDSLHNMPNLSATNVDIYNLYDYADASQFPYLRLYFNTSDDVTRTPSQLKRWQITYEEAPETAINPTKGYYFIKDTLQEGDVLKFAVATENISEYDMDSLLVRYWVQNRNNQITSLGYRKLRPHPSGDILIDTINFQTNGYPGLNHIWYEVNPVDSSTGAYDQLEQYHFNNFTEIAFYVSSDITNPLLDVTFDGVHIMNGDIVSAKPYILTTLKDENKFLALDDTLLFGIYLTNISTGIEKRIYFNSSLSELQWTPAHLPNNSCKIEYRPSLDDGKYMLRIQAKDTSNNESGNMDYKINFEVINKATITHLFNYPNPFSTSTRFVFTLTGSEVPDDLRIQIITITGKFVREIHLEELGPIHIGNNITSFYWDGTDTYGDKLANGVYFFKVIAKLHNESIEHRNTDADKFFKEGFGKMYILR